MKKHSIIIDPAGPRDQRIGPTWPRRSDEASKKKDKTDHHGHNLLERCWSVFAALQLQAVVAYIFLRRVPYSYIYISIDRQNGSQR